MRSKTPIMIFLLIFGLISTSLCFPPEYQDLIKLHPNSQPEVDVELVRTKRQAYLLGNEVSINKNGVLDNGPWGPWNPLGTCSRSCGDGVVREERICDNDQCTGPSIRYLSCNLQPCPDDSVDFRAEQCAANNDNPLDGKYFKWIPYAGKNKCELTCKPETANFYYKWADKVVDGTKCDNFGDEICVDGVCLPLGCDRKLGSVAKNDKCGICNGDGSTCKSVEGLFDESNLTPGYHDIIVLPEGATSITIEELRPTSNSLAIKNSTGHFYLNGNYQINLLDKNVVVAGTTFKYVKSNDEGLTEKLTANGPLKEPVTIALLLQRGAGKLKKNSVIKYEFSIPLEKDVKYLYRHGPWSGCSVTCGRGVKTRDITCVNAENEQPVSSDLCEEVNATKPEFEKYCSTVDCVPEWYVGEWEECSQTCGDRGLQFRVVYCHRVFADGRRMTVSDGNCTLEAGSERPALKQPCNRFSCPDWHYGPWSACSSQCGTAKQFRSVTCRSEKEGEEGKLLPADACLGQPNEAERECNLGPCEGLKFHTTEWDLCQKCNETEETRNVTCRDQNARIYPLEKCLNANVTQIPIDTRTCASQAPCIYEWHVSQWSKCSTECGHGHKSRKVFCAINELDGSEIKSVDESLCTEEKPLDREECVNEEKCTGTYFTGPWTKCSEGCGGGKQSRAVVCLNYDRKPVPEWCDEKSRPIEEQDCNVDPCPTCGDSEFGCCPDNITFALGPFNEGCSNCSISEFGCCADNITEATGPDSKGCLEYIEVEASGEEPADELCEITNEETNEKLQIPCASTIAPPQVMLLESLLNETTGEGENATLHCSKTKFGCCPDWHTPAEGKNLEGCPQFVLGNCNGTKFGCCLDEVTFARGPNYEGCGEPTCAASLYGCCKDRKTIAFGPHYSGCERSSFPCELSTFGCCPDGETAALSKNGTGCESNCLITKFGCCPDGVNQAKGPNNEGCGCGYSQFGCCPDGKSSAKGPGYYGCPETCAQSKFGCCPDGKTSSRGPNKEGCPCQYTRWGCCPDGETTALGPLNEGCDDCRYAKHGCCPDGETKALGPDYTGCPSTTVAPYIVGGTVSPSSIVACGLPQNQGQVCHPGYKLVWFYDVTEGRCSQFWYGGCEGNENRFNSKEQCEQICVEPPHIGRCYLPKVEGPQRCNQLAARYWYDYRTRQCQAYWWRGCLGNANNFPSFEECVNFCVSAVDQVEAPRVQAAASGAVPYQPQAPVYGGGPPHLDPLRITKPDVFSHMVPPPQPQIVDLEKEIRKGELTSFDDAFCRQTVDSGNCHDYEDNWYFDTFAGDCYNFIYSGCGGNNNNFKTQTECLKRCGHLKQSKFNKHIHSSPRQSNKARDICNQRPDAGKCEGHFESYYYEMASGSCEKFEYSGCGGNQNRFHSKDQCEDFCLRDYPRIGSASSFQPEPERTAPILENLIEQPLKSNAALAGICEAPRDSGPCKTFTTKWYYNKIDGTCNRFHYGGCEGNANRFETEQECKDTCGDYTDACVLPLVIGPCAGKNERYYYDYANAQCMKFVYSGCLGNGNNFKTMEECQTRCISKV